MSVRSVRITNAPINDIDSDNDRNNDGNDNDTNHNNQINKNRQNNLNKVLAKCLRKLDSVSE